MTVGLSSCQRTTDPKSGGIERTDTPIELGLVHLSNNTPSGRAAGQVLTSTSQLVGEDIALYGVCELFGSADRIWIQADRLIDNTGAKVEFDAIKNDYRFNYATDKAYYPSNGFLNVYALYPSHGSSYVQITDDKTNAPQAQVTLADRFHKQVDVLHGYTEQLTVAQAQQAKVTFAHALAQLRIKIYRDTEVTDHPTLTKVEVRGVSKATLASIERATFTNSTNAADSLDFIAFEGSMPLSATSKETAHVLNADTALMLFPGMASISQITVTVDGNTFTSYVPKTWDLLQGKVNTLTLTLHKMEVRLGSPWETTPWGTGQGVDQGVENNGKIVQISGRMIQVSGANKVTYTGATPAKADITLLGFTHKGIAIESTTNGVFTTAPFNSGSLNDNPLYLEGLTLYDAANQVLFSGQLSNGVLSSGTSLYIDETQKGLIKKQNALGGTADLSMTFGGFGEGTVAQPYEVHSALHLQNIDKLLGTQGANATNALNGTSTGGAKFVQTQDIDLAGSSFFGIAVSGTFYGIYDGQLYQIKNVNLHPNNMASMAVGLFGRVSKATFINSLITRVVIASGQVRSIASGVATGAIVGTLSGGATVSHCSNSASVFGLSNNVGGLVGQIASTSQLLLSTNWGVVTSNSGAVGGLIGRSSTNAAFVLSDCYNRGSVTYTGNMSAAEVGGLVGYLAMGSAQPTLSNCYNRGTVSHPNISNATAAGAIVGFTSAPTGSLSAASKSNYWLTGSYTKAVGVDAGGVLAKTIEKSATDLKGLAPTLGSSFKDDQPTNPINEGYPILTWQQTR